LVDQWRRERFLKTTEKGIRHRQPTENDYIDLARRIDAVTHGQAERWTRKKKGYTLATPLTTRKIRLCR